MSDETAPGPTVWSMPLVLRALKSGPPLHTDALEAAAVACMRVWHDPRAAQEWAPAFDAWLTRQIRKVARRATQASKWRAAEEVPGVTVTCGTATVRAYPPYQWQPVSLLPKALADLQVAGTDYPDAEELPAPGEHQARLWLNPHLTTLADRPMTTGKAMAQAGHAAMLLWWAMTARAQQGWHEAGYPLAVRPATVEQWQELLADPLVPAVRDAGFTEIPAGSCTFVAVPAGGRSELSGRSLR
ncbi:peptidyl-tRNA hydrolase [Motilibacter aurantiacus]|uniref:peptidyl-tRNA hydrolase n=1 Tax=Motilibacter aurantiacus TaxID=2714955 RepID=UPI00140AA8E5|nr:peptidyl-tRNA hydrolase [Motilibacter aurantiacus]NHC47440.1 peptidyl-tRNA hydrolase [Motilibacter aurantiacus]